MNVLVTTFTVNRKPCSAFLDRHQLVWEVQRITNPDTRMIYIMNVIAIVKDVTSFKLHYAELIPCNIWRARSVVFTHQQAAQVDLWTQTINKYLNDLKQRPKRLVLFVNPYGGKRNAFKIYEKYGKPLFDLAGVDVSLIVSQRPNQIKDLVMTLNLDLYDAAACVGGDGTFSELFNGLMLKTCMDSDVDADVGDLSLVTPRFPVGLIPGGSTDTVAYCLHGHNDIETAILLIIFGDTLGLDLASVHSQNKLIRFYASVMSYGFLGDVVNDSENFRWMGPKRYDYSGVKRFFSNRGYDGEIRFLCDNFMIERSDRCRRDCDRCSIKKQSCLSLASNASADSEWRVVRGKFFMVSGANVSCACKKSPNGLAPYCHIGDGCVDLIVVRHTSWWNVLRLLLRSTSATKTINNLPFVEIYRVNEFEFKSNSTRLPSPEPNITSSTTSVWNCDGEIIKESNIHVRVHCQMLRVFARGLEDAKPRRKICCF